MLLHEQDMKVNLQLLEYFISKQDLLMPEEESESIIVQHLSNELEEL